MKAGYFELLAGMAKGVLAHGLVLNHICCIELIAQLDSTLPDTLKSLISTFNQDQVRPHNAFSICLCSSCTMCTCDFMLSTSNINKH